MTNTAICLSDYLSTIKHTIDAHPPTWVSCQIRAINSKSGHYYLELADDDGTGQVVATIKGTLWRTHALRVMRKFQQGTQMGLTSGLSVLIYGQAKLHVQYGLSFQITDIDPAYTVGRFMLAYQHAKEALAREGLLTRNKAHPMPFDLQHVAVVAPEQAAGLGDFQTQIDKLAPLCHFSYHYATFQGAQTVASISQALQSAIDSTPDLLVIIRGGGAVGDLSYLNEQKLATIIAKSPVPVWSGIGHARDHTLLDEVAHSAFDTPSKVAAAIEQKLITTWQRARRYFDDLQKQANRHLYQHTSQQKSALKTLALSLAKHTQQQKSVLQNNKQRLHFAANNTLTKHKSAILHHLHSQKNANRRLMVAKSSLQALQTQILCHDPKATLARGYAVVYAEGRPIKTRQEVATDKLMIAFSDGVLPVLVPKNHAP